jgi:hypothetical protein
LLQLHTLVPSFSRSSSFSPTLCLILHNAFRFYILSLVILCELFVHFYRVHFLDFSYFIFLSSLMSSSILNLYEFITVFS